MVDPINIQGVVEQAPATLQAGGLLPGWQATLGIALIASVMILVFIYILGVLLRNQNTISFVKLELYEVVFSVILAGMIVSAVSIMGSLKVSTIFLPSFPASQLHAPGAGLYEATQQYYIDVSNKIVGWMAADYLFGIWIDNLASATPYSRPLGVGLVAAPLAGFASPLKQIIYNVNSALAIGFILNTAQRLVFEFAVFGFLNFYLPLGILLRSFTPTRRIGGMLIALGLGFLFILPFVTILDAQIVLGPNSPMIGLDEAIFGVQGSGGERIGGIMRLRFQSHISDSGTAQQVTGFTDYLWNFTIGALLKAGSFFQNAIGELFAYAFLLPLSIVGMAFAVGYLLPALNVLILVQSVKYMSQSLGEEIDITTLTRMI